MTQKRKDAGTERRSLRQLWRKFLLLLGPSAPLLLVLALYIGFKGTPHFFLHTLMG